MLGRFGVTSSSSLAAQSWDGSLNKLKSFLTLLTLSGTMACRGVDSLVFVFLEWGEKKFLSSSMRKENLGPGGTC